MTQSEVNFILSLAVFLTWLVVFVIGVRAQDRGMRHIIVGLGVTSIMGLQVFTSISGVFTLPVSVDDFRVVATWFRGIAIFLFLGYIWYRYLER